MIDDVKYTVNIVGNRSFYASKMTSVVIPPSVTTITYYGFQQANSLRDICIKGPLSATDGGAQTVRTISLTDTPFGGSGIKFVVVGPNLKLGGNASKFQVGSSGAQFLLPKKSGNTTWTNNTLSTDTHTITYYGPDEGFDMAMGETEMTFYPKTTEALASIISLAPRFKSSFDLDTKTVVTNRIEASESVSITDSMLANVTMEAPLRFLAFTPTTANALTNVLSWAPSFMTRFGLDTHISVTNTLDLTGVTITPAMVADVTFDRLMFAAKTQAQLDGILGAFPATTPISIDPTGLTENMIIPDDCPNVYVKTVPGVTVKRTTSGFMLVVK